MPAHGSYVQRVDRGYRAYHGILKASSEAAKWRHKMHPPIGFNLIETAIANTVEQGLRMKVTPAPSLTDTSVEEIQHLLGQAEVVDHLIRHEHRIDGMDQKQRPLLLEQAITGRAFGKDYWNLTEGNVKRQGVQEVEIRDAQDNVLGTMPTITEITETKVLRDHSTFEVLDSRDVIVHESAQNLQPWEPGGCQHLFHRGWYSFEQLKTLEDSGYLKNVDELKETRDFSDQYGDRERILYDIQRDKDLIEVIEYWCYKNGTVYRTIMGQRRVILRDEEESPFWHGGYPFVVCRAQPQNFSLHGKSEIELIEQIQEGIWELMNQRFDNVELVNNMVMLVDPDADEESFQYYPGAHWPALKDQVTPLQVPYQVAEVSLAAETALRGELQNVTSSLPFASGADTQTVDNKTATGASIVMSAAQNRLSAKKYQAQFAFTQEAYMRLKNCQQFLDRKRTVHILGPDGEPRFREISPLDIQGEYGFELTPYGESQLRQERRAEATQKTQVLLQALPMGAATGEPMSFHVIMTEFLKEWGDDNPEKYFSQKPASLGAMAAPGGGADGAGAAAGGEAGGAVQGDANLGTTSQTAVDASSPSATGGMSMSPQLAAQRALALSSGPRNA